jgi:predicted alpha/beta-hydrolase family hydrolase
MTDFLFDGPSNAPWTIALAHGAGAGHGLRVARFEFPYMAGRRVDGKKRGPDRPVVLQECWHAVIAELDPDRLIIGGKSMGGRIASLVADDAGVAGLVCYGYPFHPPGRPEKTRTEHLAALATPTLICQGTRDAFGTPEDIAGYALSPAIRLHWLEDGDHSFKPRKASGRTAAQNIDEAIAATAAFAAGL